MSTERLSLAVADETAVLTVRRPEKLNALDGQMVAELQAHCTEMERRDDVGVVILTGAGEKAFSAGGDIAAWGQQASSDFGRRWVRDGHDAFNALARMRQAVIAVLNGHALGGGLELAACADFRIAESHVRVGQPETGLGIIPGWSGTQRAVRRFGAQRVRRMVLFGEEYDATTALEYGLVDQVVPRGTGLHAAKALAQKVLRRGRRATELAKMLINAAEGEERERVLESIAGAVAATDAELREGIAAFREKRAPNFGNIER